MTTLRLVADSLVLLFVLASALIPTLKWGAAALGAGLSIAALTNTCALGALLSKLPYNRGPHQDITTIIRQLTSTSLEPPGPPAPSIRSQ